MFYHCKRNTAWKLDHPQGMQTYVLQKIKLIHIRHAVFVLIVLHTGTWHYSFFLIKNIYPLPNNTLYIFYEKNLKRQVLVVLHYVILISRCMKKFTIKICAIFCNQTIGNYTRRLPFLKWHGHFCIAVERFYFTFTWTYRSHLSFVCLYQVALKARNILYIHVPILNSR